MSTAAESASRHARLLVGLLALMVALALPSFAGAGEITVFSCHDPAGSPVGHDGWTNHRTADTDMVASDSCAAGGQGALSAELAANGAGYGDAARTEWDFAAPAWASVASYTLHLAGSYALPSTGGGSGQAFVNASDESDPNYDYRNLGAAAQGPWTVSRTPPAPVQTLTVNASCDGQGGPCPAGQRVAQVALSSAEILMRDPTTPTVSSLSGTLVPGASVRGSGEVGFDATDSGPGVYAAQLSVDGHAQPAVALDRNDGWCVNLGQTTDGTRSFAHPDPCLQSVSGALTLDTTVLADGEHDIRLSVEDASGNTAIGYDGALVTHNAPVQDSPPTLTGSASTGSVLSVSPGEWSAPAGAGAITYGYQWEDCNPTGGECQSIAGASAQTYSPTGPDQGHTLKVTVTASDQDGAASASSPASQPIPATSTNLSSSLGAANGTGASEAAMLRLTPTALTRAYADSALTVKGTLTATSGTPIGSASLQLLETAGTMTRLLATVRSAANGTFTASVPRGGSRTLTVAYRAYASDPQPAASATIRESVPAPVTLRVSPRRASPTGRIELSGRVAGPVPVDGVIVDLLVHYRGRWEPFRTPRTDRRGAFRVSYQFQGARGRFPFRAHVPGGQAGYDYSAGQSRPVIVRTR